MSPQATPENSLLRLIADMLVGRRMASDISVDAWLRIAQQAERHGLAPMLHAVLRAHDLPDEARPALTSLAASARQHAVHWMLLERAQSEIVRALDHAGIPAIWLKGGAFAHTLYPDPALRPMVDLDVLVPFDQREDALRAVQVAGYDFYESDESLIRSSANPISLSVAHHYTLRGSAGGHMMLELHFRLLTHDDTLLSLEHLAWFWKQRQIAALPNGLQIGVLSPEANILYLSAHALLQHGRHDFVLLRYLDMHRLIEQSAVEWETVVERAATLGWTSAVDEALRTCVEYFATPVPESVLADLHARRTPADAARVERLTGVGNRWERVQANLRSMSVRDALTYALRIGFPPPSYMRRRYAVAPSR